MRNMPNSVEQGPDVAGEVSWIDHNWFIKICKNNLSKQSNYPVGIHWQVSQACTLQNIDFVMSQSPDTRHVGIFQKNGSGGFVSDLLFIGGKYGWVAGSQQYTASNIKFRDCR
jgi:Pectate lyase superfamily protein